MARSKCFRDIRGLSGWRAAPFLVKSIPTTGAARQPDYLKSPKILSILDIIESILKIYLALTIVILQSCATTQRVAVLSNTALEALQTFDEINYSFKDHCILMHELENYKAIEENNKIDLNTPVCADWNRVDSMKNALISVLSSYFSGLKKLSDEKAKNVYLPPITKHLRPGSYLGVDLSNEQVSATNNISEKLLSAALGSYRNNKIKKFIAESDRSIAIIFLKSIEFIGLLRTAIKSDQALLLNVYTLLIKDGNNKFQQIQAFRDYSKQDNDLDKRERQFRSYISILKGVSEAHHEVASKINTLNKKEWQHLLIEEASEIYLLIKVFKEL